MKIFSFFRRRHEEATEPTPAPAPAPSVSAADFAAPAGRQVKTANQPFGGPVNSAPAPMPRFGQRTTDAPRAFGQRTTGAPQAFGANAKTILEELKQKDAGIVAAFITSNEGRLAERTEAAFAGEQRIGVSSSISLAVARKEALELGLGEAKQVLIKSEMGFILLLSLGSKGVLTIVADQRADAELILQAAQKMLVRLMLIQ